MKKVYRFVGKEELDKILSDDMNAIEDSHVWEQSFTSSKGVSFFESLRVPLLKEKIVLTNNETGEQTIVDTQTSKEKLPIIFFVQCFGRYLVEYEVEDDFFEENFKKCSGYYDCEHILVEELYIKDGYTNWSVSPVRYLDTFLDLSKDTLLDTTASGRFKSIDEIINYLDYDASLLEDEDDSEDIWFNLYEDDEDYDFFDEVEEEEEEIFA
jgi:hypothetical protein